MRMIPELIAALERLLPPWALVPVGLLALAVVVPAWLHWLRTKQIKGQLRRMLRAPTPEARAAFLEGAFARAAGKPRRLVFLADEALRLGQQTVFRRALRDLEATGKLALDQRRLRGLVAVEAKRGAHPLEEAVIIERMIQEGMYSAAQERLSEVRGRFPADEELAYLQQRLHEARREQAS